MMSFIVKLTRSVIFSIKLLCMYVCMCAVKRGNTDRRESWSYSRIAVAWVVAAAIVMRRSSGFANCYKYRRACDTSDDSTCPDSWRLVDAADSLTDWQQASTVTATTAPCTSPLYTHVQTPV